MGKSSTPKYRIELRSNDPKRKWDSYAYLVKNYGKPTEANAKRFRNDMNASFQGGGTNYHITEGLGYVLHYSDAQIVEQKTGRVVAKYKAPVFEVV